MRTLWTPFHDTPNTATVSAGDWLCRLARALLDHQYVDPHPWIAQGRDLFQEAATHIHANPSDNQITKSIGHTAGSNSYEASPEARAFKAHTDTQRAVYRDDNRYFWAFDGFDPERAIATGYAPKQQVRKQVNLMAFVNELEVEGAGDDAQEVWVLGTELFPYEDLGVSFNALEGQPPVLPPVHYPEWDHMIQLERPAWATVQERHPKVGDAQVINDVLMENRGIIGRMKFILDAMQPQGVQRIRKLEDGDEIDLNATLSALIDVRMGRQPDSRIMMRSVRKTRDISILVLLDLSQSTNEKSQRKSKPSWSSRETPAHYWPMPSRRSATHLPFMAFVQTVVMTLDTGDSKTSISPMMTSPKRG